MKAQRSLHGDIADLQIYDQFMRPEVISEYVNCRPLPVERKPIISFENVENLKLSGSTRLGNISQQAVCNMSSERLVLFPEKRDFLTSFSLCRKLQGRLLFPASMDKNEEASRQFLNFSDSCLNDYSAMYWIGIIRNGSTGDWIKLPDGKTVRLSKPVLKVTNISTSFHCVASGGDRYLGSWLSVPCHYRTCPVCRFEKDPIVRVKGLCPDSLIERQLFIKGNINNKPSFEGPVHISIQYTNVTWILSSRSHERLRGELVMEHSDEYPFGRNLWIIEGDQCNQGKQVEKRLLMTACKTDEYSCDDGFCIPKNQRCDLVAQCQDKSDEEHCDVLKLPWSYSENLPPPVTTTTFSQVFFRLNMNSIKQFDLLKFKLSIDASMRLRWRDPRIRLKNLRRTFSKNVIDTDSSQLPWTPKLKITDGTQSLIDSIQKKSILTVIQEAGPLPDQEDDIDEDDWYSGAENSLFLIEDYAFELSCEFQLTLYPFDSQKCLMTFSLYHLTKDLACLLEDSEALHFTGQRRLLEYKLESELVRNFTKTEICFIEITLTFRNLFGYFIGTVFVPSFLVTCISYLTFSFPVSYFQDRIMVSMTSLLVLANLFIQTSQSIPKTTYLKLIDIWYLILIVVDFSMILCIVVIENIRVKAPLKKNSLRKALPLATAKSTSFRLTEQKESLLGNHTLKKYNSIANVAFAIILVLTVASFSIVGMAI